MTLPGRSGRPPAESDRSERLPRLAGFGLILLAGMTWGTTGATMKLVAQDSRMSPLLIGFFRVAIAAPCLWGAARAVRTRLRVTTASDRGRLLIAGLAMGAYQACYFWGVANTSVAVGSLIAICSAPLMIAGLAAGLLGERITGQTGGALLGGITGAALLTFGASGATPSGPLGLGSLPPRFLGGVLLALGAGLAYAIYAVVVKDVGGRLSPLAVATATFGVATISLAPVLFVEPIDGGVLTWGLLAYLGLVPTALAYILYNVGLRTTSVTVAGVLTLMEPLTATLLGALFFGDRLGSIGALGAALLVGAVLVLTLGARRPAPI